MVKDASLMITDERRIDSQMLQGKVPIGGAGGKTVPQTGYRHCRQPDCRCKRGASARPVCGIQRTV